MSTYIIGHIKPDLDSAVSAVSLKYLFDRGECFQRRKTIPVLASPANKETQIIFKKVKAPLPKVLKKYQINPNDLFVLVDHSEKSQRLKGIKNEQITDIFDHHKMVVNFSTPIFITTKPWGSTNTIIYWFMQISQIRPSRQIASLMLAAILSDTVGLKSATTTDTDRQSVKELNKIAQIPDIDALTLEIFKAKSNINNLTPAQIVTNDYKIYKFSGRKVLINQVETVEQEKVLSQKQKLLKAMEKVKIKQKLDLIFMVISDVLKVNSKLIYSNEQERKIVEKAFQGKGEANVLDIGSRLSRKKQIAPEIERVLK